MTNNTTIVRDFSGLSKNFKQMSRKNKIALVEETINTSRYEVVGPVNQSGKIKLRCKYHNRRDTLGRWTAHRR